MHSHELMRHSYGSLCEWRRTAITGPATGRTRCIGLPIRRHHASPTAVNPTRATANNSRGHDL